MYNVVVCGEKLICEFCIKALKERDDVNLICVFTSTKDWETNLNDFCTRQGIKCIVGNINNYHNLLKENNVDFIFSIQERRILTKETISLAKIGCYNLHFGELEKYAGCSVISHAILNGEKKIGATLHELIQRIDAGPIICKCFVEIEDSDSAYILFKKISLEAAKMFYKNIDCILNQTYIKTEQNENNRCYYTRNSIDFENDSYINLCDDILTTNRKIRAFTFPPMNQYPKIIITDKNKNCKTMIVKTFNVDKNGNMQLLIEDMVRKEENNE